MSGHRPVALITGACGGMGSACARQLGRDNKLVLTDVPSERLHGFAATLRDDGYEISACLAGDLSEAACCDTVIAAARAAGTLKVMLHAAGTSPALAPWDAILRANLLATERLLLGLEADLPAGFVAILIASMAGHMSPPDAVIDAVFSDPLAANFLQMASEGLTARIDPADSFGLASPAYFYSKRAVIRNCERRGPAWARRGARIVTISPGIMWTPMGRREAEVNPVSLKVAEETPIGRWGNGLDISAAVEFLASDRAGYITGCDLRIDGGATPALRDNL